MNGQSASQETYTTWKMLKITYGIVALVAGADKFFDSIVHWEKYVSPIIAAHLPIQMTHFMYLIGIIEIIVGLLILTHYTRIGAYLLAGWLGIIVLNLISIGTYYDIAIRDVVMMIGALALAQLTHIQEKYK